MRTTASAMLLARRACEVASAWPSRPQMVPTVATGGQGSLVGDRYRLIERLAEAQVTLTTSLR